MEDLTGRQDLWCKMFRRYLEGNVNGWYKKLLKGSIHNFEDLKKKFCKAFNHLIKAKIWQWTTLKERETETLGDFVKRFNKTLGRVIHPDDSVEIIAFRVGLKPNKFAVSLYNKKPKDLAQDGKSI